MSQIKFGTDGWRAIIAKDYTVDNVIRVATATAMFVISKGGKSAVVGHDCRFAGEMFAETTAKVLAFHGIKVYLAKDFVSTPMVSLGVVKKAAFIGVVITASHNPPDYNGYKLKSYYGGPSIPADISAVEHLIPENVPQNELPSLEKIQKEGLLEYIDLEQMYLEECRTKFDLESINKSFVNLAYDAMYGAGQRVIRQLLTNVQEIHCEYNPSFYGQAPEPIHRNLKALSELLKNTNELNCGLANDGDADRIGMYDEDGNFVDSHHILLLLIHYLYKYKGMDGKVVVTFSVTDKVKKLCELYNLPCEVTKIGFKYIAEIMTHEKVLVGGEESGGIAAAGHIPERDGIWMGLILLEFMAKTGKTLKQLIAEIYNLVGSFSFDRDDYNLDNNLKLSIVENCKNKIYNAFGSYKVIREEDLDGFKYYFDENTWIMVRASGTEPVLRIYAQAPDSEEVRKVLDAARITLIGY
jgi:phosphomannomutase